ncbi:Uncharacterised protein [Vibrio cholerae]|nr:Uncharacterised protein [Vibrio cholerae]
MQFIFSEFILTSDTIDCRLPTKMLKEFIIFENS